MDIAEMAVGDRIAPFLTKPRGGRARTVRASPTHDTQLAARGTVDLLQWDIVGHIRHFLGAKMDHVFMIERIVTDVSRPILFFEATDPMGQALRPRQGPWSTQTIITLVRQEGVSILERARMLNGNLGQSVHIGDSEEGGGCCP